jgi:hypothetical protein
MSQKRRKKTHAPTQTRIENTGVPKRRKRIKIPSESGTRISIFMRYFILRSTITFMRSPKYLNFSHNDFFDFMARRKFPITCFVSFKERDGVLFFEFTFASRVFLLPIVHHTGNHAMMTIARRRKKALGMALQKNWNSLASGKLWRSTIMRSAMPIDIRNASGKIKL